MKKLLLAGMLLAFAAPVHADILPDAMLGDWGPK
jgi:hypothetical protein